ncbi:MAG: signal recognition particle-docking protein FtsY [Clostridia bacterium]|nr:signal recognition particle-docking protein FtsY [Clostridia bacterium]
MLERLKAHLARTRERLGGRIQGLLTGRALDESLYEELFEILVAADCGPRTSAALVSAVREEARRLGLRDAARLPELLARAAARRLSEAGTGRPGAAEGEPDPRTGLRLAAEPPTVVLLVGVNGSGKTTTAAKLAYRLREAGQAPVLAAADTFRAAAAEQLRIWAERIGCDLVRQAEGGDPAAVVFDAIRAAEARGRGAVVVDTAGRLHTKGDLMAELGKVARVAGRAKPGAPHEILLVIDAPTGQNGLAQARSFHAALGLTGLVVTKLDGTAKGGVTLAIADELGLPVRFVGLGEGLADLRPFDAESFAEALFLDPRAGGRTGPASTGPDARP